MFNMLNKINGKYYYLPFGIVLLIGGLGIESLWIPWAGIFVFSLLLTMSIMKNMKLFFPEGFKFYLVILLLLVLNTITTKNMEGTLNYLFLFLSGGIVWLYSFNNLRRSSENGIFATLLIALGLFFGQYVIYEQILGSDAVKSFAIAGYSGASRNHNHIGDYFSIIAIICAYNLLKIKKNNGFWLLLSLISFVFIFVSQSRSALVSVGVPLFAFFMYEDKIREKFEKLSYFLAFLLAALILYFGRAKSLLLSRQYFLQGIAGFWKHPFGVGMGNFGEISSDATNHIFGANSYSMVAHNLPLEFLTGMGYLGIPFVIFYFLMIYKVIVNFKNNPIFALIFLGLSINFFFDFTYAIPTMLWVWFASLGILQSFVKTHEKVGK